MLCLIIRLLSNKVLALVELCLCFDFIFPYQGFEWLIYVEASPTSFTNGRHVLSISGKMDVVPFGVTMLPCLVDGSSK